MDLPLPVLHEEARLMRDRPDLFPEQTRRSTRYPRDAYDSSSWSETISSTISYASSYLTFGRSMSDLASDDPGADKPKGYWGRRIQNVVEESEGRVPPLLHSLGNAIVAHCTGTEGVFRKTSNVRNSVPVSFPPLTSSPSCSARWSLCSTCPSRVNPPSLGLRLPWKTHCCRPNSSCGSLPSWRYHSSRRPCILLFGRQLHLRGKFDIQSMKRPLTPACARPSSPP